MGSSKSKTPKKVLLLGLEGVGKTKLLYKLPNFDEAERPPSRIFFNTETLTFESIQLDVWDLSGKLYALWHMHYVGAQGIIFVIDSTDKKRVDEAKEELHKIMLDRELTGVPILIYANKQDLPNAMTVGEIEEKLELSEMECRKIFILAASATQGNGIYEGLNWLLDSFQSLSTFFVSEM